VFSFRVDGRLNGVRIRRNFKTLEQAAGEKAALELKGLQLASNPRAVTTVLAEDQVREAGAAFRRLEGHERSLAFYLDFALSNYREPMCQTPLSEAAEAYLTAKTLEHHRQIISAPQLTTIRRHLEVLKAHFPRATVAELSASRLTEYLQHGKMRPPVPA
jgi:hypothetical protein